MRAAFFCFLLAAAPIAASAAPTEIAVTGQGTVSVSPDIATESFTIATYGDAATRALSDNNERFARLQKALERLGVAASSVQTTGLGVSYTQPPQAPEAPQPGQRYGYAVSRSIQVTLHSTTLAGKAIDTAAEAGVTDVGDVTFDTSNRKGAMAAALRAAVADARAQGDAIAAAAGLRIAAIKRMDTGFAQGPAPRPVMFAARAVAAPTQIAPSPVDVQATVTIVYEAR